MDSFTFELGHVHFYKQGVSVRNQHRVAYSVDPHETTAHYEPFHLDLHGLPRYLVRSSRLKGFITVSTQNNWTINSLYLIFIQN